MSFEPDTLTRLIDAADPVLSYGPGEIVTRLSPHPDVRRRKPIVCGPSRNAVTPKAHFASRPRESGQGGLSEACADAGPGHNGKKAQTGVKVSVGHLEPEVERLPAHPAEVTPGTGGSGGLIRRSRNTVPSKLPPSWAESFGRRGQYRPGWAYWSRPFLGSVRGARSDRSGVPHTVAGARGERATTRCAMQPGDAR